MILRDPQLTESRRVLRPTMDASQDGIRRDAKSDRAPRSIDVARDSAPTMGPAWLPESPAPREPAKPDLTFESVVAWLAVQDEQTRKGCASVLASDLTRIYEFAKSEGFSAGRQAAAASIAAEIKQHLALLDQIASNAQLAFDREQEQLQALCVEIVGEALSKVAGPLLASNRAVLGAVREVLERVRDARELTIRVAREDLEFIRSHEEHFKDLLGNRRYEFIADNRIELGGCIVETKSGSFDGRLEVQLRELYETLRLAKQYAPETP